MSMTNCDCFEVDEHTIKNQPLYLSRPKITLDRRIHFLKPVEPFTLFPMSQSTIASLIPHDTEP